MKRPYEMRVECFEGEHAQFCITFEKGIKIEKPSLFHALRVMMVVMLVCKDVVNNLLVNKNVYEKAQNGLAIYIDFKETSK